ncbi:MAG: hypothetical protein U1E60_11330 [Reyranellaceae bacterium]
MKRSDRTLDEALAKLSEGPSLARLAGLYTKRYRLPSDQVLDAIQTAFCKVLEAYAGKIVDSPEALLHRVIRNELITVLRRSDVMNQVEYDDDYMSLAKSTRRSGVADSDTDDAEQEAADHTDDSAPDRAKDPEEPSTGRRTVSVQPTAEEMANRLENTMLETIDARELVRALLKEFDAKYRHVVVLLLQEWEPNELREKFGQNAYRLRAWARVKVCRVLAKFAAAGNDQAERLHARGGCQRMLQSLQGAVPA